MKKIYISGAITNNPFYKDDFARAAAVITAAGCEAVNPATVEIKGGAWLDYMRHDIKLLADCDGVYMLAGWNESQGARVEHQLAQGLGLKIYYEGADNEQRTYA